MEFTTIHSINISNRNNNQQIFAKVVKARDIPYFDLRLYINEKPTTEGVFIDPVEFHWLKNEINSGNKICNNGNRTVTINQLNDEVEICLEKEGQVKKSITITKDEVLHLYKELDNIAKIIIEK
jgi:hypothetical protein